MTVIVVSSGVTSVGVNMSVGDLMTVSSSGLAVDTTDAGALIEIFSGGVASRTALESGATLFISSGGSAVSGTADLSSELEVLSGGSLSNFTISGLLLLDQGGSGKQIVIGQGGVGLIESIAVSGQVAAGGAQDIFLHGIDEFGAIAGVQRIFQGEVSQDTILAGGFQEVNARGIVSAEIVNSGGSVVVSRFGDLIASTVDAGGTVMLGGEAIANFIAGSMTVLAGGLDRNGEVLSGGGETLSSGGEAQDGLVDAGGVLTVLAGGLASQTEVAGREVVGSGGLDLSAAIDSGGLELISGGAATSGAVQSGGRLQVLAGGLAFDAVVSSGGRLIVGPGGSATRTDLQTGATAIISSGGTAASGLWEVGTTVTVSSGGRDQDEEVGGVVTVRGLAIRDTAIDGGQLVALSGGAVVSATVEGNGEILISNGGKASATRILGEGTEVVLSGGVASSTKVLAGGQETVAFGAVALQLTVSSGGSATVAVGGKVAGIGLASGATLTDNGQVLVGDRNLKGTLSGAGVIAETSSNGLLVLSTTGAAFHGRAVISGGRIELAVSGAIGSGQVGFFGGAVVSQTLQIDAAAAPAPGATFANTLSNFNADNKAIDLRGLAFHAGASATLSGGVLTLVDGGQSFRFKLAGLIGKSFSVAADGHGGTQITAHAAAFTQAAATLAAPGPALQSPVSGYGAPPSPFHAGAGHA